MAHLETASEIIIRAAPSNRRFQPKCQYCDQLGHTAKICPKLQSSAITANCASSSYAQDNKWLIDSAASHNIRGDLQNLSIFILNMTTLMSFFLVMVQVWQLHILVP